MDANNVYRLAVQVQFAIAARELVRLELEEDKTVQGFSVWVDSSGGIDVHVKSDQGLEGYSL